MYREEGPFLKLCALSATRQGTNSSNAGVNLEHSKVGEEVEVVAMIAAEEKIVPLS